jgi:TRAP transporter 4TM/12TM fusion protein
LNAAPDRLPDELDELIGAFDSEASTRRLSGLPGLAATLLAIGLSVYALYWVVSIVQPQIYRVSFLLVALTLSFLLYPAGRRGTSRGVSPFDWLLIACCVAGLLWPLVDFERFIYRAAEPNAVDLICGTLTIVVVLEATRRTAGWILPAAAGGFILYAYYGPLLDAIGLDLLAHRGYPLDRVVGSLYMTLEGIFGVPLDVAATYIVLFTIYGAVLQFSGAGRFFLDWAMAASGRSASGAAPGRTVTIAGFLLGSVSGSGVATTVMLGSVAWPLLRSAGYSAEVGGAILSAGGIGAILSPPTLGAAAFLIAEFLRISYLRVLVMASVPTLLYYISIFLMIEADSRRLGTRYQRASDRSVAQLTRESGYHFTSLVAIALFMALGMTAFKAVFWATVLAVALSFVRPATALWPRPFVQALEAGGKGVVSVAATTATAGIIVGIVTLTGLGLKIAGVIVALAGGSLPLTVLYSAGAVWLLGLAVPVTASYIIAAVMIAHPGWHRADGGAHVHLLLRRALGSEPADRPLADGGSGADRRQSVPHDDDHVEVHAARLSGAVRVHAEAGRPGDSADRIGWRDSVDVVDGGGRRGRARDKRRRVAATQGNRGRAATRCGRRPPVDVSGRRDGRGRARLFRGDDGAAFRAPGRGRATYFAGSFAAARLTSSSVNAANTNGSCSRARTRSSGVRPRLESRSRSIDSWLFSGS